MLLLKSVLLYCLLALATAKFAEELLVTLPNGSPVYGHYKTSHGGHGIRSFTNIPYAEAPVGKLRFADPVPKEPWTGELGNSKQVIMCPQEEHFHDRQAMGQEDCLYLNVHVPMHHKSKSKAHLPLPVMFFIHGGAFVSGSGNEGLYGPEFLLDEDVIYVSGNYRLGALGFLSTFTEEFPGNYGLKDQVLMMKWIQENIQVFGGDPKKVTIFGESAGAGSVSYHLLSPMSKGLFQQAIMHSGTAYENWSNVSQAQSLKFAEKMIHVMECEFTEADYKTALECLREKDYKDIVANMKQFMVQGSQPIQVFAPVKEVNSKLPFITEADYMKVDAGSDIPVMMGLTANEGAFLAAMIAKDPKEMELLEQNFDEVLPSIVFLFDRFDNETMKQKLQMMKQHYFNGENFKWATHQRGLVNLFSDVIFLPGFVRVIRNRLATPSSANTFAYLFNYRGSTSFTDIYFRQSTVEKNFGVSHIDDLFYLFPLVEKIMNFRAMNADDNHMRKHMVKMWTNFAMMGNPSTKNVQWTPVKAFPIDYLRIGNCNLDVCDPNGKTLSAMEIGFFEESVTFLDELYYGPPPVAEKVKEEL